MLRPRYRRSRAALDGQKHGESWRTIIVALVANVIIAVAKLISGLVSHSTALIAESAHSFADASNEVFLGISLRRAAAPPDDDHPLGHGRERFLWAFIAAIASFLIGGCFSVALAIRQFARPETIRHVRAAWIVLLVALIADGISWAQSIRSARNNARRLGFGVLAHLRLSSDPTVRAVVVEDSAALIGLVIAAGGLLLSRYTGSDRPDAIASLLIGVLLTATAFGLGLNLADFLVGKSLPAPLLKEIRKVVESSRAVQEIVSLQAVYIGPEEVIVAAKVRPDPNLTAAELSSEMDSVDHALREESQFVADVYIDVTSAK